MSLRAHVTQFIQLVERGQTVQAIEQFYAEDVVVFENREMARAGRDKCARFEREALAQYPEPPLAKALATACDEATGRVFVEWLIRIKTQEGTFLRLEEVAVQRWVADRIVEERFYYQGMVDEGDDD